MRYRFYAMYRNEATGEFDWYSCKTKEEAEIKISNLEKAGFEAWMEEVQ